GGTFVHRDAKTLHFLRKRRGRTLYAVVDVDGGLIRISTQSEGYRQLHGAATETRGLHIKHVLDAVDLLLQRRSNRLRYCFSTCTGIGRTDDDLWRRQFG